MSGSGPFTSSSARTRGSLSLPTTPLFGRVQELAELRQLLTNAGVRLLTLTGVGGAGKSRLAHVIALEQVTQFDHGAAFVDLAPVRDPNLVPAAVAQALGVQESGTRTAAEIVSEVLREGHSLVVLDNFEHLLGAAGFVANLLATCPGLVILVTSRQALDIRQERVFQVDPLQVPVLDGAPDLDTIARVPSVALFVERAQARRPDFALTPANVRATADICARLDGLPLAIELAAAQVAAFPPEVILKQLESSTPFVLSGPRDLPTRQQTLSSAIAWSYDLLPPDEQVIFRWSGVFAGGFTAEALDVVRGDLQPRVFAPVVLPQLLTKYLVHSSSASGDTPRYELLSTLRAFALQQLTACGELQLARRRHAEYFVALAEELQPQLRGEGMAAALARLSDDYANLREVFDWSSASGNTSIGLRLAAALYRFWLVRGHLAEARQWLEPALQHDTTTDPRTRAVALNAAGVLAGMQHDHDKARGFFRQSLAVWEDLADSARMADAHLNLGLVAHNLGDLDQAEQQFQSAEALYQQADDPAGLGRAIGSLARIAREKGDLRRTVQLFDRCLQLFRQAHDDWGIANVLHNLGNVHLAEDDTPGAEGYFRQALEVRLRLGNVLGVAECLEGFAAAAARHEPERAILLFGAAEALREQAGAPVPASEQARYTQVVDSARLRVPTSTFASRWADGRALGQEQAVALALRESGSAPAAPAASPSANPAAATPARSRLTRRESEIARLVALGRSNREIADLLSITLRTVETHLEHVFRKLSIKSRAELAVWTVQHGLTPGDMRAD